jgi:hypothetical protein
MEENNEYGNCWQDLVRRIDVENRVADANIEAWRIEDEMEMKKGIKGTREDEKKESIKYEKGDGKGGVQGDECGGKKRRVKEKTGAEIRETNVERNEVRNVKKAKTEARKWVKQGKMKILDIYYSKK